MAAPVIPPPGMSPSSLTSGVELIGPSKPPAVLADDIDPMTGEFRSLLRGVHPVDGMVVVALRTQRGTGASVADIGSELATLDSAACTAKVLRENGIWAHVWACSDAADVLSRLRRAHQGAVEKGEVLPTHVVVCAPWIDTKDLAAMAREFEEIVFTVISHSNVGFLSADARGVQLLREAVDLQHGAHNIRVAGNCRRFADWATIGWSARIAWLPNLYDLSGPEPKNRGPWPGDALRVGLFGASRPLKNGLTAAAAAVELAQTLRVPTELWVSSGRDEGGSNRALEELTSAIPGFTVRFNGWHAWPEFKRVVRQMHVLLQPSFTESFNMVTADGIAEGVPSAVSTAIDWVPKHWRANADDASDVARVAAHLLRDPHAADDGRRALEEYVAQGLERWRDFLI